MTQIFVWSKRRLLVDCLEHHFMAAAPQFSVVASAPGALDMSLPSVCICDVGRARLTQRDMAEAIANIRHAAPHARVLVFAGSASFDDVPHWIEAGAHGYFSARSTPALLTAAATVLAAGGVYLPDALAQGLLRQASLRSHD